VKDSISTLFNTGNDSSSRNSFYSQSEEIEKLRKTITDLQDQVLALQSRIQKDETKKSTTNPHTSEKQGERIPRRKSAYSSVIAEIREKESKMDCLESDIERNAPHLIIPEDSISAYSKAARILAESPEIAGADKETTITLLMDFHRSLEWRTDDDAMSSLHD
jgi:chromosome segregation ATPase